MNQRLKLTKKKNSVLHAYFIHIRYNAGEKRGGRMSNIHIEQQAKEVIEKIRPYINRDGGDIKFVKVEDGIVYVQLLGACIGCAAVDTTLKDGVEAIMLEEVPGVIGVEQI